MPFRKKDAALAALVGFFIAALVQMVIKNLELILPFNKYWLLAAFPVLAPGSLYISYKISLILKPFVFQFGKFFLVGSLNTFIDLGILNFLIFITNITHGVYFAGFKTFSFVCAAINSYFWNKLWTFQKQGSFVVFFLVVLGSTILNVGWASFMVDYIGPPENISPKLWGNIAALSSVVLVLTWNFLGLKFIVFRKRVPSQTPTLTRE